MNKKQIRTHKIVTVLLSLCMVVSTISGIIIVSDANKSEKEKISLIILKIIFGYPGWTSLPLLLSVFFGYLLVKSKGKRFVVAKLVADIINIILRLTNIAFTILIIFISYIPCVENDLPEQDRRYYGTENLGLLVPCDISTISRARLEFGLLILIVFNECSSTILLFISCISFLFCCCSAAGSHNVEPYYHQKESFL